MYLFCYNKHVMHCTLFVIFYKVLDCLDLNGQNYIYLFYHNKHVMHCTLFVIPIITRSLKLIDIPSLYIVKK